MISHYRRYAEILRVQKRPFWFLASRVLMRSGLCRWLTYTRNGYRLRFHPTALSATLWVNPNERIREERFLADCVGLGDTVVDVGANIGTISLVCAKAVGPQGCVVAIEPHPRIFRCLKENIALNGQSGTIRAVNAAAGSRPGDAYLTDASDDTQNTVSNQAGRGSVRVTVMPLDELVPDGPVALLKLDAEGYEPMILDGAKAVCARTGVLYSEYDPGLIAACKRDPAEYLETLRKRDFELYLLEQDNMVALSSPPDRKCMIVGIRSSSGNARRVKAALRRSVRSV